MELAIRIFIGIFGLAWFAFTGMALGVEQQTTDFSLRKLVFVAQPIAGLLLIVLSFTRVPGWAKDCSFGALFSLLRLSNASFLSVFIDSCLASMQRNKGLLPGQRLFQKAHPRRWSNTASRQRS
jgi:hypothetical protein